MFGGIAYMHRGNMSVGIIKDELMVRVHPDHHDEFVAEPGARIMNFTGRPMRGWLIVDADTISTDAKLRTWIQRGLAYTSSLPLKSVKKSPKKKSASSKQPRRKQK